MVLPLKITLVIWDWNGTLFDDAWLCIEVMNGMLAERSLPPMSAERYASTFRFPVRSYYADLGIDLGDESFERLGTEFIDRYQARQHECSLSAHAADVLTEMTRHGLEQVILSASQQWRLEEQVTRLGVRGHFSSVLGLDHHFATSKLLRGREWLRSRDLSPAEVVLVGDTDHDVEVARHLGTSCLLVPSGHQDVGRLRMCAVPVLASLAELAAVITGVALPGG
jgi:phosphoglycolate phosphatase